MAGQIVMNWLQENVIGDVLKVLGFMAATLTVVWQLNRQHKNSLALQRENARQALKLRIYETLIQRIRALSDANSKAKMYALGILPAIENFQRGFLSSVDQRAPTFSDLHFKAASCLVELIDEFECWSIAFPGLRVFQVALNAADYNVRESFPPLFSALLKILPMDPPPGQTGKPTIVNPPPSAEAFLALKDLIEKYKGAMDDIGCYIHDLTVEAQNNLLYGLFEERVPPRQPLDPRYKVISTVPEKAQALIRYFKTETPWGKKKAAIDADVMAELHGKAASQKR